MKKKLLLATAILAAGLLAGCGKDNQQVSSPILPEVAGEPLEESVSSQTDESESSEELLAGNIKVITDREVVNGQMQSYLTGEWKDESVVKRRSMAVMIPNNMRAGYSSSSALLHQHGISKASIIYEAPVEGRITRLMCFFEDYDDLDYIGPIRSSRDYYVYEAMAYDAIYVNWGLARPFVEELINSDRVDNVSQSLAGIYNGAPEAFGNKSKSGYASEFTSILDPAGYTKAVERLGYSAEYTDRFEQAFTFADDGYTAAYEDYPDATSIWPGGRGNNAGGYGNYGSDNVHFEYNEEDGLYYRYQYGSAMTDEYNDEHVAVRNVVFKLCHGELKVPDDKEHDYLGFGVHGTGDCYVFTNGKVIKGTWQRNSDYEPNLFLDEKGNEIIFNQGKTWICNVWKEYAEYIDYQ
ncbi:MAG: DUF3048 domain-containing protein [Roseburia sp.]|nr:DUF3048 domain-containing protein [Roseburia sp.]